MKPVSVLNKYFNDGSYGVPSKGLKEFIEEVKELPEADKIELAELAAVELGVPLEV